MQKNTFNDEFLSSKGTFFQIFSIKSRFLFLSILNLANDANDSIDFFTTNKTSKVTRHVSEGKFFPEVFGAFWKIFGFPCCCPIGLTDSFELFREPYKSNEKLIEKFFVFCVSLKTNGCGRINGLLNILKILFSIFIR